jgi:hypothetical protein
VGRKVVFVNVILKYVVEELLALCAEERGMLAVATELFVSFDVARKHIVMKPFLLSPSCPDDINHLKTKGRLLYLTFKNLASYT